MNAAERPLLALLGPSASGKTALSLKLQAAYPLRLISVDSMQVYRGLDIGTAKPAPSERGLFSLIDVADPGEGFSAGRFASLAAAVAEEAWKREELPCLVGGTGLYARALLEGMVEIPAVTTELRRSVAARNLESLAEELKRRDPETASKTDLANPRRVQRAIEVLESTGQGLNYWHKSGNKGALACRPLCVVLDLPAGTLKQRIRDRTQSMLSAGWREEAQRLEKRWGRQALLSTGAIGYKEMLDWGEGKLDRASAFECIASATTRYARRQRTWFKAQKQMEWMNPGDPDKISRRIEGFLKGSHG